MRILDLIPEEIRNRLELREGPHDRPDAPRIVDIKHEEQVCEGCSRFVANRTIECVQFFTPFVYWRTQCKNCKRIENPITGAWETMNHNQIISVFRQVSNKTNK